MRETSEREGKDRSFPVCVCCFVFSKRTARVERRDQREKHAANCISDVKFFWRALFFLFLEKDKRRSHFYEMIGGWSEHRHGGL